ncbi:TetR/AcrR family transcriptional regulator C-terminal domain-containing protein [Shimazuella alba]|uniref:TetR family transcriptional regulator n=1 Tax=Shimazuella alba TaxID=2690964 RepID=A0A6I4W5A8_9BACL|nr:TetR/AcrR family transcriptional regulator C-terminal domain-containing protein [Shimazuella alba]MXQ55954.1 TetR family transcriptional regulator [Shimazuella alba]
MARRRRQANEPLLDQKRIVVVALELIDKVGLHQLTMRKLAESLGIQAGALYWHVKNKEELLGLLVDEISSKITWPEDEISWKEAITSWARSFRNILHRYRDSAEIFNNSTFSSSYNRFQQIENLFYVLSKAGFRDEDIPWMASMIKNHILGFVSEEVRFHKILEKKDQTLEELGEEADKMYQTLSKDSFPSIARLSCYMTNPNWDREFDMGINVLLNGFTVNLK